MPMTRHTAIRAATLAATLGAVALVPLPPLAGSAAASTAVAEVYPVPPSGVFTVEGHGFGHGYGMSQWGAEEGAREGASVGTILGFYYPGATLAAAGHPQIRVALTGTGSGTTSVGYGGTGSYRYQCSDGSAPSTTCTLSVVAQAGLTVTDAATGAHPDATGVAEWRVSVAADGLHLSALRGGVWSAATVSGRSALAGPITFTGSPYVRVDYGSSQRDYRGTVSAVRTSPAGTVPARFVRLDTLGLDDYVRGVVYREASASWPTAALEAQAVAARSYADAARVHAGSAPYDICDSTYCQVFGGTQLLSGGHTTWLEPPADPTRDPVALTADQVLTVGGVPLSTMFGSSNGGWTTGSGFGAGIDTPRLDRWDAASGDPQHDWTATLSAATLAREYGMARLDQLVVTARDGTSGDWGGRVRAVELDGVDASGAHRTVQLTSQWSLWFGMDSSFWHITNAQATSVALSGPPTAARGHAFPVQGTAPAGASVTVWVRPSGDAVYHALPPVTADAAGAWSTSVWAALDTAYYAVSGAQRSAPVTTRVVGTSAVGPATAAIGSTANVTGYAAPGATVNLYLRPASSTLDRLSAHTVARADGSYTLAFPVVGTTSWFTSSLGLGSGRTTLTALPAVAGPASAARGSLVTVTGRAVPHEVVSVWLLRQGDAAYRQVQAMTADASGAFHTRYLATSDAQYYALDAAGRSASGLTRAVGTTATGPASAAVGSRPVLTGYAQPGAQVTVHLRRFGTANWVALSPVTADPAGRWSRPFTAATSYAWYADAAGYRSLVGTTRAA